MCRIRSEARPCPIGSEVLATLTITGNVTVQSSGGLPNFVGSFRETYAARRVDSAWLLNECLHPEGGGTSSLETLVNFYNYTRHLYSLDSAQFVSVSTVEAEGTYVNCLLDDVCVISFIILNAVFGLSAMCQYHWLLVLWSHIIWCIPILHQKCDNKNTESTCIYMPQLHYKDKNRIYIWLLILTKIKMIGLKDSEGHPVHSQL